MVGSNKSLEKRLYEWISRNCKVLHEWTGIEIFAKWSRKSFLASMKVE